MNDIIILAGERVSDEEAHEIEARIAAVTIPGPEPTPPAASLMAAIERYGSEREWYGGMIAVHIPEVVGVTGLNAARNEVRRLLALTLEAAERYASAREDIGVLPGADDRATDARAELGWLLGVDDG